MATAEITGNPISTPFSVTSVATLTDTLTFSCTGTCGPLSASLVANITGAVFSQLGLSGVEYDSYTAAITDTSTLVQSTMAGELCPTLAQSASCTMAETNPSTGYTVTTPFTIVLGDPYSIQLVMTSFVSVPSGNALQVLATQSDPLSLNLPTGVSFASQSGAFLVPEPSSWVLVGGGLALCLGLFRRRMAVRL
jgi:hypothetical protein